MISMMISSLAALNAQQAGNEEYGQAGHRHGTMGTCSTPWRYWAKLMAYMARRCWRQRR